MFSFGEKGAGGLGGFGIPPAAAAGRPPMFVNGTADDAAVTVVPYLFPPDIQKDNILIAMHGGDGDDDVPTWPAGWTELYDSGDNDAGSGHIAGAWLRAAGGESGTLNVTTTGSEDRGWGMFQFSGCHLTEDPEASLAGIPAITAGTSFVIDAITPSWGEDNNLYIAHYGWDVGSSSLVAHPASMTELFNKRSGSTFGGGSAASFRRLFASTTHDPANGQLSHGRAMHTIQIAIRGAPPTGGAPRCVIEPAGFVRGRNRITVAGYHRLTSG